MMMHTVRTLIATGAWSVVVLLAGVVVPTWAEEIGAERTSPTTQASENRSSALQQTQAPVEPSLPFLMAEGSNSCEIVSCGMGIKQTCQITCPADKTPKCSCDCERSFGPMCMDYKANCRCE